MKTRSAGLLAALVLFAATVNAQQAFAFSGVPWGASVAVTSNALKTAGYTVSALDKDGDLPFEGTILDRHFNGWAFFAQSGLVKVQLTFIPDHGESQTTYHAIANALTTKYGSGQETRYFEQPYDDGDGYEETAIAVGKGHIFTMWSGADSSALMVMIDHVSYTLLVRVSYESTGWHAEFQRRQSKAF